MHDERILRLVGNGQNDVSGGGGIPLPDAFRAVLRHLLDRGMTSVGELSRRVADELILREDRVLAVWGSWEALTQDLVDQLAFRNLIVQGAMPFTSEMWELAPGFQSHPYRHTVIGENEIPGLKTRIRLSVESSASEHTRSRMARLVLDLNTMKAGLTREELLTPSMDAAFIRLVAVLSRTAEPPATQTGDPSRHAVRYGYVGYEYEPEDQPGVMRDCKRCGREFPHTREHFQVYKDATRGQTGRWYWRPECNPCRVRYTTERDNRWMDEIVLIIKGLEPEEITLDVVTGLMKDTNDRRRVMNLWNRAAREGLVPPCPKKPRNGSRPGLV